MKKNIKVLLFPKQWEVRLIELEVPEAMINSKASKDYWDEALNMIASKKLDLDSLITKQINLE